MEQAASDSLGEELYSSDLGAGYGYQSSAPNMIGDNTIGGCGGLYSRGALVATIAHPTFACSRLNIAENNSPAVRNRVYATYRHFHNATFIDIFGNSPQGLVQDAHIDRITFGVETTLTPDLSLELRVPVNSQLGSKLGLLQGGPLGNTPLGGPFTGAVNNAAQVVGDMDGEIGNLSLILKGMLWQSPDAIVSSGLGVNIPTAPDVRIGGAIQDTNFPVFSPGGALLVQTNVNVTFDGIYRNQTVNLQPFLAGVAYPTSRTFLQGFAQLDLPLNESYGDLSFQGVVAGTPFADVPGSSRLAQQTLLRLNVGGGVWFYHAPEAAYLRAAGGLVELHYTTTLNDSDVIRATQRNFGDLDQDGTDETLDLSFGNVNNRVDSLNITAGIPVQVGLTRIMNAVVVPLREGADRGYDAEYVLIVDRMF
ncbi:MAG: hypothetical protein AB7F89_09945 [Pirellulaceae bacterium]